jgi:hypothetical protein
MEKRTVAEDGRTPSLRQGIVAGLLGGTAVVVFFFLLDIGRGEAFATPAFLAGAVFGNGTEAGAGSIAAFTVLHYAAFAAIGGGAVILFRWARLPQNLLLGAVYGLFVCSMIFYVSLVVTGTAVLPAAWWEETLIGNVLAGLVMGTYLHWVGPQPGVTGVTAELRAHPTLREGFVAGFIGAMAVAVWFLVVDAVLREPLYTPAALGSALLGGAGGPAEVQINAGTVLGYTAVHVTGFLLLGVVAAGLVAQAEKFPPLVWALTLLFVVFEVLFVGLVALLGAWILEELAWWSVLLGNLLAAVGMGGYLWRAHPVLQEEIRAGKIWAQG